MCENVLLTCRITITGQANIAGSLEEVLLAPLAVGTVPVLGAVSAAAAVASALVQVLVEHALVGEAIAVAR